MSRHFDLARLKGIAPLLFITTGLVAWRWTSPFSGILPWLIGAMLFFAVLNMRPSQALPRGKHLVLLCLHLGLGGGLYLLLSLWDRQIAASLLMCFLAPAATAAGAMTSLMEGDTAFATGYTILTHLLICIIAPLLLPLIDTQSQLPFWTLSGQIALLVLRMVVLPISLAWLVRYLLHRRGRKPRPHKTLTYWLWLSSLIFILGKAVDYVSGSVHEVSVLLVASFLVGFLACALQFTLGQWLAPRLGLEVVACRQAMGQKNTALVLWLCISFMHPLVAPGIAGYIAWQNFFLSYFMSRFLKRQRAAADAITEDRS